MTVSERIEQILGRMALENISLAAQLDTVREELKAKETDNAKPAVSKPTAVK